MTAFRDFYTRHIYKASAQMQLEELDMLINTVIGDMTRTVSPTEWNQLLQRKEELEIEREQTASDITRLGL